MRETFAAPNGKRVEVLVKGPEGPGTYSRAIAPGETADAYFPTVVVEAVRAGAHHLVIPKGVYSFQGPTLCTDLKSYFDNSQGGIGLVGGSGFGPGATNLLVTNNFVSYSGQSTQYSGAVYMFAPTASGQIPAAPIFEKLGFRNNVFDRLLGPAIMATSARFLSIENNTIINSNRDRSNPIDYGEIPTLDSIIVYQASDGTVCDTGRFGDTTDPIGVDPTAKAVSVKATCP